MTIVWQAVDSSIEGVLQPRADPPPFAPFESTTLENWLQHWIAAVTYIDGERARPRWQQVPPNIPDFNEVDCWLSLGIIKRRPLNMYSWVEHRCDNPDGTGHDLMSRHEEIEILVSFWGREADTYATNFHSGLMLWQNTHLLRSVGMAFADISESIHVPELIKEQWLQRIDKTVTLRRSIMRNYPVRSLIGFHGWVHANHPDVYNAPFGYRLLADDAPDDGTLYGRRNRHWEPALPLTGGQMEGELHLRQSPRDPRGMATKQDADTFDGKEF